MKKATKNDPRWGGVFSDNNLVPEPNKFYITNLQDYGQPGSHWTALLPNGFYIDSFGVGPTRDMSPFVKEWNTNWYQAYNQNSCGYYAMYFVLNAMAGRKPDEGLIPGKEMHNEDVLKKFFFG